MNNFDKLFFAAFEPTFITLVVNGSRTIVGDIIDDTNKLSAIQQYNKLLGFIDSYILVEDKQFKGLEEDIKGNLQRQEQLFGKKYAPQIFNMIPKAIKELKRKYPERLELEKTEEEKQEEREQIRQQYEEIKSKEGVPDLEWPEQFKKMVNKFSSRIPTKYLQTINK